MSKLEKLNSFINIVESNGLAPAARKQGISTAAISKQLTSLEDELGVQLLKRTTRQITLTEVGIQYFQHCKKILADLQEAENAIAGAQDKATGVLKLLCNRYYAFHTIIPRLPEFRQQNPKLEVNIELAERFPDFEKEDIDIAYGISLEGPPELIRKRIEDTTYILCAAPNYLRHYGTPQTIHDLNTHQYISHSMRKPLDVITFKEGKEIYLPSSIVLNDIQAMRECALQGMGIVRLHQYVVADALQSGELVEILPELKTPPIPIYLYYQKSRYLLPKIRRFIDFFVP